MEKRGKKAGAALASPGPGGAGFLGFWDKMQQPRHGEKIPCGIRDPFPRAS